MPVLQEIQDHYGYVPEPCVHLVAERLNVYSSQIYGVLTFYAQFHLEPRGKYIIRVCMGTACHVKGAGRIGDTLTGPAGYRAMPRPPRTSSSPQSSSPASGPAAWRRSSWSTMRPTAACRCRRWTRSSRSTRGWNDRQRFANFTNTSGDLKFMAANAEKIKVLICQGTGGICLRGQGRRRGLRGGVRQARASRPRSASAARSSAPAAAGCAPTTCWSTSWFPARRR